MAIIAVLEIKINMTIPPQSKGVLVIIYFCFKCISPVCGEGVSVGGKSHTSLGSLKG